MLEAEYYYLIGASAVGIVSLIYIFFGPNPAKTKTGNANAPISGLQNVGNNCFTNAIIQALANSESMSSWLADANRRIDGKGKLISTLSTLVTCINQKTLNCLSPREVIACLTDYEYGFLFSGLQQDAHEFLNAITATLEKEFFFFSRQYLMNGMLTEDEHNNVVMNALTELCTKQSINRVALDRFSQRFLSLPSRGLIGNHLACHNCKYKYPLNLEVFNVITLNLPPPGNNPEGITLEDCIAQFIKTETIEDFNCESCSSRSTFAKKLEFIKLPQFLCLHLQRLVWLGNDTNVASNHSQLRKRVDQVIFPEVLIMDPFTYNYKSKMISNSGEDITASSTISTSLEDMSTSLSTLSSSVEDVSASKSTSNSNEDVSTLAVTPDVTSNAHEDVPPPSSMARHRYRLSSVIVHFGSDSSGHYICYRRLHYRGQHRWLKASDENVTAIDAKLVLSCSAYMIFYERIL